MKSLRLLIPAFLCFSLTGCFAVPDYQLPLGFSSTFHQSLLDQHEFKSEVVPFANRQAPDSLGRRARLGQTQTVTESQDR